MIGVGLAVDPRPKLAELGAFVVRALHAGRHFNPTSEKTYQKLKAELVEMMEGVRFNNARVEQLVEQLYELNRRLVAGEGKLLRLAESCGIKREEFLANAPEAVKKFEVSDPAWFQRLADCDGQAMRHFEESWDYFKKEDEVVARDYENREWANWAKQLGRGGW